MLKWAWKHGKTGLSSKGMLNNLGQMRANCHGFQDKKTACTLDQLNQSYFDTLRSDTEEAFLPEGPEGPEIDVSVPLTRQLFETAAADVLKTAEGGAH